jgi:hypothetical protein
MFAAEQAKLSDQSPTEYCLYVLSFSVCLCFTTILMTYLGAYIGQFPSVDN